MKLTPRSTARRRTAMHVSRSAGGPQMPSPVIRMAPKPMRRTVRSPPTPMVPDPSAGGVDELSVVMFIDCKHLGVDLSRPRRGASRGPFLPEPCADGSVLRARLRRLPLGQLDHHPTRSVHEDKITVVEVHHL